MYHRQRFRLAIVVVLTLLLTVALATAAAAQTTPPPTVDAGNDGGVTGDVGNDGGVTETTPPPDVNNGNGTTDPPDLGNGDNGDGTTPTPGNGDNGNGTTPTPGNGDNGDTKMPPSDSWPPPNAIVHHAATPVQLSALSGGLNVYLIGPDGTATSGTIIASLSTLAEMHPSGDAVSLYSGTNPGSGKPVTIEYLPAEMKIRVSTFYADKPPHDFDKAYIFTVDADHSVTHEKW